MEAQWLVWPLQRREVVLERTSSQVSQAWQTRAELAGARVGAKLNHNPGLTIPSSLSTHLTARPNVLCDTN